jgi:hypothetical protein
MKTIHSLLFAIALAGPARAQPTISIGDFTLVLAFASKDSLESVREYIPKGESLDHWSCMASVRVFPKEKSPLDYLQRVGARIPGTHPAARAQLLKHDKTGDNILDFVIFTADSATAEWNLMRARYEKGKGLVVFQYAKRFYSIDKNLGPAIITERLKMIDPFEAASFEESKEANQTLEATPPSGTPRADARVAPAGGVAHL